MKIKSYNEALARIKALLATKFVDPLANASAYQRAIYGTTIEDQKRLFGVIIAEHGITIITAENSTPTKITGDEYSLVAEELSEKVVKWTNRVLNDNKPLAETASYLWDKISLLEGQRPTIAFSFLLNPATMLVPYAPLPDAPDLQPAECFCQIHNNFLPEIATIFRILRQGNSLIKKTAMIHQLIEGCKSENDKLVLLSIVAHLAIQNSRQTVIFVKLVPNNSNDQPQ